jgi:phosphate:Na+ symporter
MIRPVREAFSPFLAGLGLFFLGLHLVSTGLHESSSRRLRALIRRSTTNVVSCAGLGVLAGTIMQSTSAVVVILGNMAVSGLIALPQALPVLAFANVGTTILVFIGSLDIHAAVLTLVGLSAIAFSFTNDFRMKTASATVLGTSLLLYGGDLLTRSAVELQTTSWFSDLVRIGHGFEVVSLGIGIAASFLSQSTTAVALIAAVLCGSGLMGLGEALLMVYGGNVGSTLARMLMTRGHTGVVLQVARFQDGFKIVGGAAFVCLFYIESYAHVPLVQALVSAMSDRPAMRLALANFLLNATMAIVATANARRIADALARRWPPAVGEDIAAVQYVNDDAVTDPESAIDLFEKEQVRIMTHLRSYLDVARAVRASASSDAAAMHRGFLKLFRELDHFYGALLTRHVPTATAQRFSNVQARQKLVELIEDSVHQVALAARDGRDGKIGQVAADFTEALDFFLLSAGDALTSLDRQDARLLQEICSDRSDTMIGLRNFYLSPSQELAHNDKALLLQLTTLFERIVWMLHRYAVLLEQNADTEGLEASAAIAIDAKYPSSTGAEA